MKRILSIIKGLLIFVAGMITMLLLIIFGVSLVPIDESLLEEEEQQLQQQQIEGLTLFQNSKEETVATKRQLNVIECLSKNIALVESGKSSDKMVMLLIGDSKELYYDNQKIDIPEGKSAKQAGIYQYKDKYGKQRTVPVVRIK